MGGLSWLNGLSPEQARGEFLRVCGSAAWAKQMESGRPYSDPDRLHSAAKKLWEGLPPDDWLEAFACHPKIGDKATLRKKFSEQSQVAAASEGVLDGLEQGNKEYEKRFGFIFIVCATGKSAEEMLTLLNMRLKNGKETEIYLAAAEQAAITKLRLEKLLQSHD